MQLLLYRRGCVKVLQRLRAGVVLVADTGTQQQSPKQKQRHFGGLHGPGRLQLGGKRSRGYLPDYAASDTQSTPRGARPGPTLAPWCAGGSPACPAAESARKDPRPEEKKSKFCTKIVQRTTDMKLLVDKASVPAGGPLIFLPLVGKASVTAGFHNLFNFVKRRS